MTVNTINTTQKYALNHRATEGHFVDHPIIPGVTILADVLRAIRSIPGDSVVASEGAYRVRAAKFLHPVRPGDEISIALDPVRSGDAATTAVHFVCRVGATVVAKGTFEFDAVTSRDV